MLVKCFNEHHHSLVELGVRAVCEQQVRLSLKDIRSVSAQAISQGLTTPQEVWDFAATIKASFLSHWGVFQVGFWGKTLSESPGASFRAFTHILPSPVGTCNLPVLHRITFMSIMGKSQLDQRHPSLPTPVRKGFIVNISAEV